MNFLRITTLLVLLLAGATLSICPSVAAVLYQSQTAESCCGHTPTKPEPVAGDGECGGAECGCVTCLVVILPSSTIEFSSNTFSNPLHNPGVRKPPVGYLASIDYPPENICPFRKLAG